MDIIKKLIPLTAFCLYFGKIAIIPASSADAIIMLVIASLIAFQEYFSNNTRIQKLEENIEKGHKETAEKLKDIEALKSNIASIKIASGMRTIK